jgi:hypothetical protein
VSSLGLAPGTYDVQSGTAGFVSSPASAGDDTERPRRVNFKTAWYNTGSPKGLTKAAPAEPSAHLSISYVMMCLYLSNRM